MHNKMKSIKITMLEAVHMEGGDAGHLYDAIGEAIALSVREGKPVNLTTRKVVYHIDPIVLRDSVAETVRVVRAETIGV